MSSFIINSHLRCTSFGLKRNSFYPQSFASEGLLKELCRQNSVLLEEWDKIWEKLSSVLNGFFLGVVFTDSNGTILSLQTKPDYLDFFQDHYLVPGWNWREEKMGTNAIGCSLVEGIPLLVEGEDHFFLALKNISMASAPIQDMQNRVLGTIGFVSSLEDKFRLSLSMAILASDSLEARIHFREYKSQRSKGLQALSTSPGKSSEKSKVYFEDIYSNCPLMDKTLELARKAVFVEENILLTGESGVGKEMIAQAIHNTGPRKDEPFAVLSAGSILDPQSRQLSAIQENIFLEKVLEANRGTLYLDEISELSERSQDLLLRLVIEKKVLAHGDDRSIPVDLRIISSSTQPLKSLMKKVRPDLLFRLKGIQIDVPSLRERSDIIGLAKHFLKVLDCSEYTIDSSAQRKLLTHHWSGNIRELQSVMLNAAFLAETGNIRSEHIQLPEDSAIRWNLKYTMSARDAEKIAILDALNESKGNISKASEILGISRSTLYRKFREYNITS